MLPEDSCEGLPALQDAQLSSPPLNLPPDVPALRTLYLYLSAGCNLHCRHCWITPTFVNGKPKPAECLDFKALENAVAEAKPLGLSSAKLTGGEPTLHPEFVRIVDFLADQDVRLSMETNGTLIDAELARHLSEKKFSHIAVSLDSSDPAWHDRFRGRREAFDDAVRGVGHLVGAGVRPQIIMSVCRDNLDHIEALIALAQKIGAGSVKFNPVTPSGRGAVMHSDGGGLTFDEHIDLTRRIRGELQDRFPIHLCIMVPPALLTAKEILRDKGSGGGCNVRHILGLLGTGEMALCGVGRNVPELCFGTLGRDSLRDVWISHPTLVALRKSLDAQSPGLCGDCVHAKRCLTHCVAMNYEMSGKLVNVSPLCAEAERRGVFPASRRVGVGESAKVREF